MINPKFMPRYIVIKLLITKDKEKIMKAAREKWHLNYRGKTLWITTDFSSETMKARRKWDTIFQVLGKKNLSINFFPGKIFIRNEGEIKTFSGKGKLREFLTSRPTLKEWLWKFSKQKRNNTISNFRNRERTQWVKNADKYISISFCNIRF